ncbi:tRNA-specific adenosine deaminase 1 [[Candida] railenensis]|uniref:tRNA-specific adenosine deaminase 1 n=1 Tax=[Candida] railenensis TaxID=45579 RepID=A0A9P0QKN7_9ASCO|nr:tRNA-specific adenosine deaminase 1 [[Candida] railenensis]
MDGNRIAECVVSTFNKLPSHGKPATRSNNTKEWTVLASIVALIDDEVVPICLSTGVKTLPEKFRTYSGGLMVHDLHAEILVFRLFNWYLLEECSRESDTSILVERTEEGSFRIKDGIKLALFVTEPPCGDSSMSYIINEFEDQTIWNSCGDAKDTADDIPSSSKRKKVTRGRQYIDSLGIVRTKPGRLDSPISLSKSCSDKICMKQLTGITNCITSPLFPQGIFLDYLVLDSAKFSQVDMERCFKERFTVEHVHPIKILEYGSNAVSAFGYSKEDKASTSSLSLLYVVLTKTRQVLNNGVKDGAYSKNKPPKKGGESLICNQKLFQKARPLLKTTAKSYVEFKDGQLERQKLKELGRQVLGNWTQTGQDDFALEME